MLPDPIHLLVATFSIDLCKAYFPCLDPFHWLRGSSWHLRCVDLMTSMFWQMEALIRTDACNLQRQHKCAPSLKPRQKNTFSFHAVVLRHLHFQAYLYIQGFWSVVEAVFRSFKKESTKKWYYSISESLFWIQNSAKVKLFVILYVLKMKTPIQC